MVFISLVVLIEPLKDVIELGRDADHLDCTNTSISVGRKATCILVDMYLFYFFGMAMAGAIGLITVRKISQAIE